MSADAIVSCLFCGRARSTADPKCECGRQDTVPSFPGGFYDHLTGVHHDKAIRDRVFTMRRRTKLTLRREPENEFDANAIAVHASDKVRLGYLPKTTAAFLAPAIDAGEKWSANIAKVLGREERYAVMVMFVHLPDTELPERDAWYSPMGEATPEFYRAVSAGRGRDDDDDDSPMPNYMARINLVLAVLAGLVICGVWQLVGSWFN